MARKQEWKTFGQKLRSIRETKGLSLEDLSLETGYTSDLLDQVEKDETVPPVSLVLQLGLTFHVDMEHVSLKDEKKASRKRALSHKKRVDSYSYESLTSSGLDKHLRAYLVTIEPKTEHRGAEYHHEGEEFIYVLKGGLTIQIGENISTLTVGENIHFNSALNHLLSNPTKETAELLVVIYVP